MKRKTTKRTKPSSDAMATVAMAGALAAESKGKTAAEGRVTVHLSAELSRALRLAAADRACSQSEVVSAGLRLLFSRKAPPGYTPPSGPDLSSSSALKLARQLKRDGRTHRAIAEKLNRAGFRTTRGAEWTAANVAQRLRLR